MGKSLKDLAFVTCLYDLVKRGSAEHRTYDWMFANAGFVLGLDQELVIFTDPELEIELRKRRAGRPTKIVPIPFEALLRSDRFVAAQTGILQYNANKTKVTPTYVQLMWAKYAMLDRALTITRTSHLGWIDMSIAHVAKLPPEGVDVFSDPSDRPRVHVLRCFDKLDVVAPDYWHRVHGHLAGGLVVGARGPMRSLVDAFWEAVDGAISRKRAPLDEGLLSYVVGQRPDDFSYSYGDYEDIVQSHDIPRGGEAHRKWIVDDVIARGLTGPMARGAIGLPMPKCYVVSLASATDRRNRMRTRMTSEGLAFEIIDAYEGTDLVVRDRAPHATSDEEFRKVACLLSHLRALQAFLATPATEAIICEDDARPRCDFARHFQERRENMSDDVPLVALGYLVWDWEGFLWTGKDTTKQNLATIGPDLWGTQMYLIRRAWAAECVARFGIAIEAIVTDQIRTAELITRESASKGGLITYPPLGIEDLTDSIISPGHTNHSEVIHWDSAEYVP